MSEAKPEDRFDAVERHYEERQRGADELSRLLGLDKEEKRIEPVRDEQGRFVGGADAGERGIEPTIRKPPGELLQEILQGFGERDESQ